MPRLSCSWPSYRAIRKDCVRGRSEARGPEGQGPRPARHVHAEPRQPLALPARTLTPPLSATMASTSTARSSSSALQELACHIALATATTLTQPPRERSLA
eukprot:2518620-Rhodomonas_salina.2